MSRASRAAPCRRGRAAWSFFYLVDAQECGQVSLGKAVPGNCGLQLCFPLAREDGLLLIWKLLARTNRRLSPQGPAPCEQLSGAQARPSSASSGAGSVQASQCGANALRRHPPQGPTR